MKIIEIKSLAIPDVKVIKFGRFADNRGYFTETFRNSDFKNHPQLEFFKTNDFCQCNESYSKKGVIRGLHLQHSPYIGKLVRPVFGHLIDIALDVRKQSPTFGKIIAHDMPATQDRDYDEWIWLPPGFAHGIMFPEHDSLIEYFCTGEYNPAGEVCISPFAQDLDWSLCDKNLAQIYEKTLSSSDLIAEKDRAGLSLEQWQESESFSKFTYGQV